MSRILQVGLPSLNNSPSCEYSRVDFDNDEDFLVFFTSENVIFFLLP